MDRASFTKTLQVVALRVPARGTGSVLGALRGRTMQLRGVKNVVHDEDKAFRRVLMPPVRARCHGGCAGGSEGWGRRLILTDLHRS